MVVIYECCSTVRHQMDKRILKMQIKIVDFDSSWACVIQLSLSNTLFDLIEVILLVGTIYMIQCGYSIQICYDLFHLMQVLSSQILKFKILSEIWNIVNSPCLVTISRNLIKLKLIRQLGSKTEILFFLPKIRIEVCFSDFVFLLLFPTLFTLKIWCSYDYL